MFKLIITVLFFFGLLFAGTYTKMLSVLVENKRGTWWSFYWTPLSVYRHFKKFIFESDLDSYQKKEYLFLYKTAVFAKWGFFLFMFFIAIILSVLINFFPDKLVYLK